MELPRESKTCNTRIEWVDLSKGIGILFVMYGHCYLEWKYCYWIYSFHMALFFFLSGYTFHADKTNHTLFVIKKIKTILIPYLFFAVTTTVYDKLQAMLHAKEYSVVDTLLNYILQQRYTLLWFLTCLFIGELIVYGIYVYMLYSGTKVFIWLITAVVSFSLFFIYRECVGIDLIWNADLAILAVSFITLGIAINYINSFENISVAKGTTFISLLVSIISSWLNYNHFEVVDWYSNSFGNPILFFIAATSGIVTVISFSLNFSNNSLIRNALIYLGRNSLVYYGFHRIIIDMTFALYNKMGIEIIKGRLDTVLYAVISVCISLAVLTPVNIYLTHFWPMLIGKRKH